MYLKGIEFEIDVHGSLLSRGPIFASIERFQKRRGRSSRNLFSVDFSPPIYTQHNTTYFLQLHLRIST